MSPSMFRGAPPSTWIQGRPPPPDVSRKFAISAVGKEPPRVPSTKIWNPGSPEVLVVTVSMCHCPSSRLTWPMEFLGSLSVNFPSESKKVCERWPWYVDSESLRITLATPCAGWATSGR